MKVRVRVLLVSLALGVGLLGGCGAPEKVVIEGDILKDGQPYKLAEPHDTISVTFHHQTQPLKLSADVDPAKGTFVARGPTCAGLPSGDYAITVRVCPYNSALDRLKERYSDPKTTPFRYSASEGGEHSIIIDLKKGSLTAP